MVRAKGKKEKKLGCRPRGGGERKKRGAQRLQWLGPPKEKEKKGPRLRHTMGWGGGGGGEKKGGKKEKKRGLVNDVYYSSSAGREKGGRRPLPDEGGRKKKETCSLLKPKKKRKGVSLGEPQKKEGEKGGRNLFLQKRGKKK